MNTWTQRVPAQPLMKRRALDCLIERRPFPPGTPDWNWRTEAAQEYMLMAMDVPATVRSDRNV